MNLQLTPEQFVALYELVSEASFAVKTTKRDCFIQLREKLSGTIQESLEKVHQIQNKQKLSIWVKKEQEKLDKMNQDLENIKKETLNVKYSSDDGLHFPSES
jgi:glycogen synthase